MLADARLSKEFQTPDIIPHKRVLRQTTCQFESSASEFETFERAFPVIMKHWAKEGFVERWRVVTISTCKVTIEGLLIVVNAV